MQVVLKLATASFFRLDTLAATNGLIYLSLFTLPFPLTSYYNTRPPVDYTKLTNYSPVWFIAYVLGIGLLFGLYVTALRLTMPGKDQAPAAPGFVLVTTTAFATILLFSYPLTAIDLFIYAIRTRGWALYDLPPLATPPEALPATDPWLGLAGEWIDTPSPYGPLWEWISLGTFYLSGGNFLIHLFTLKLIGVLAYLACSWLVFKILRQVKPRWAMAGTIAFAWNPLVLFESVQNAHNDIVMMFFFLAALWVYAQSQTPIIESSIGSSPLRRWTSTVVSPLLICALLALSVLVKFVTVIVSPFMLMALSLRYPTRRQRALYLALLSLITGGLIVLPMLPVWPGWDTWAVLSAGSGAGRSLLALLVLGLRDTLGLNTAFDLAGNLILIIFGLIYLYYLWPLLQLIFQPSNLPRQLAMDNEQLTNPSSPLALQSSNPPSFQSLILPIFQILFWYVLLAAPVFHAWYLLWFAPLACLLLPNRRPLTATIVFSMTALLIIPYFETVRVWYPYLLQNHFVGHLIGVPLLLLPPAITLLWPTRPTPASGVSSAQQ